MSAGSRTARYYPEDGSTPGEPLVFDTAEGLLDYVREFHESGRPGQIHIHLPAKLAETETPALAKLGARSV